MRLDWDTRINLGQGVGSASAVVNTETLESDGLGSNLDFAIY